MTAEEDEDFKKMRLRHHKEREELEQRQEKELVVFRTRIEARNPKFRPARQKQARKSVPAIHQGIVPRQKSADELVDHSKHNGYASEHAPSGQQPQPKRTFSNTDKEIEQLVQFESNAKKALANATPGMQPKLDPKLSLNQIKESQSKRDMVPRDGISPTLQKRPTPPPQTAPQGSNYTATYNSVKQTSSAAVTSTGAYMNTTGWTGGAGGVAAAAGGGGSYPPEHAGTAWGAPPDPSSGWIVGDAQWRNAHPGQFVPIISQPFTGAGITTSQFVPSMTQAATQKQPVTQQQLPHR
ncbi:predicted protein [Nematostella vectensis]|uniref:Uncharacterized protein n=2 Tax=Nematostella vectensis TaxID=45351 RepID=A7S154_NEMVE|nr:predicted protein [Nematostella vectensis]|eukprot:XP_001634599.1 predicted protein [Nematostella vectensis]